MMRTLFLSIFVSVVCGFTFWGVATAQTPNEAEMRQQLAAAGMTPAQIEEAVAAVAAFMPPAAATVPQMPTPACVDENQNAICDEEESDPQVTQCRRIYLNSIEKAALDNYGNRLGESAMRIAQTCSTAAVGGTLYVTESGSTVNNMDQMLEISGYWNDVLSYARYLEPSEVELNIDAENTDRIIAKFPRDLRALIRPGEEEDAFYLTALPIHERCEKIRDYVGQSYRQSVHDRTICLTVTPQPDDAMSEAFE